MNLGPTDRVVDVVFFILRLLALFVQVISDCHRLDGIHLHRSHESGIQNVKKIFGYALIWRISGPKRVIFLAFSTMTRASVRALCAFNPMEALICKSKKLSDFSGGQHGAERRRRLKAEGKECGHSCLLSLSCLCKRKPKTHFHMRKLDLKMFHLYENYG